MFRKGFTDGELFHQLSEENESQNLISHEKKSCLGNEMCKPETSVDQASEEVNTMSMSTEEGIRHRCYRSQP